MPYVGIGWGDVEWHLEMALLTEGSFFNLNSRQGENFICCILCHPIKNCDIYEKVNKEDCTRTNNFFAKKGWKCFLHGQPPTLASFCLYFTYKSTTGFPTNYIVIKVMHLVSVTGSQTHNLSIMSPLDRGFRSKLCVVGWICYSRVSSNKHNISAANLPKVEIVLMLLPTLAYFQG